METKGSGKDFSSYVDRQCCDKEYSMNNDPNVNGRALVPPPAPAGDNITTMRTFKTSPRNRKV